MEGLGRHFLSFGSGKCGATSCARASGEKSSVSELFFPPSVTLLWLLSRLFSNFQMFNDGMFRHGFLWVNPVSLLSFLNLWVSVFCHIWEILSHYLPSRPLSALACEVCGSVTRPHGVLYSFPVRFLSPLQTDWLLLFCLHGR